MTWGITSPARWTHPVALADVLACHLLPVMQGGAGDGDAADLDRQHERHRRHHPGAADARQDREDAGDLLARRELEGEGPARMARGPPQGLAGREVVQLDDDAVDLIAEVVALRFEVRMIGLDLLDGILRGGTAHQAVHPQSPGAERLQHLPLGGDLQPFGSEDVVGVEVEGAGGGHLRIELPHRAGGGVARVGERLLAFGEEALVQLVEVFRAHDHLAAHGDEGRDRPVTLLWIAQAQGDARDGADVRRDPLAAPAVAACRGLLEHPAAVDQLDREAVELGLEDVLDGKVGTQPFAEALVEPAERRLVLVGVQGEHRRRVLDGREAGQRLPGHALRGRVFGDQVGELLLQGDQLMIELVVRRVGERRLVFDVVEVIVVADLRL
jgi:hypothetical protein